MNKRNLVLVVDDDRIILDIAEDVLGGQFDVALSLSGEHALELLSGGCRPDLILLDIDMPGIDGYETLLRIRKNQEFSDVPVIFLTGLTDSEAELTGLELGAQDYITKPFIRENLVARLRLRLESGLQARQLREVSGRLHNTRMNEERFLSLTRELTPAERDVARLIASGLDNQEIANRLHLSHGYIRNLSTIVYDKLGVRGRRELRETLTADS